jgi:hypothetical protein
MPEEVAQGIKEGQYDGLFGGETLLHAGNLNTFNMAVSGARYGDVRHCVRGWAPWSSTKGKSRGRPSGGSFACMHKRHERQYKIKDSECASIQWIRIDHIKLLIAVVYILPESSTVWTDWEHALPLLTLKQGIIAAEAEGLDVMVIGDLNARIGEESELENVGVVERHVAEPEVPVCRNDMYISSIPIPKAQPDQAWTRKYARGGRIF